MESAPLAHRHADANGLRLHYAAAGEGHAAAGLILFAHGFPEFWYAWRELLPRFGRDRLAVAPDLRGYNLSAKPAGVEQYAVRQLVEDLRALAADLGRGRFTLVGHDWGGVVAWAFALCYPALLDRLVIINAPHPALFERELRDNPAQGEASAYIGRLRQPDAEDLLAEDGYRRLRNMLLREGLERGYFTDADRDAYVAAWSRPGALTAMLNYYRAMRLPAPTPAGQDAPAITPATRPALVVRVPTLVIWGERDTALLPGNLDGLDDFVPDLTLRRIPDAGHWVIHEQPALVTQYIRGHLD